MMKTKALRMIPAGVIMLCLSESSGGTVETRQRTGSMEGEGRSGWVVVNDGVMGGVSQSRATLTDRKTLRFSGTVSLENNGGFASIRHPAGAFGIGPGEGISLSVRGDGKKYQLRVRTSDRFDGIAYKVDFMTVNGEWQELRIPWAEFTATWRGRSIPGASELKGDGIVQVGFLIADKQEGPFELEVAAISAFQ
jgi:monofunctional biosynthetic peptidoglycan transglycosylase